MKTAQIKLKNSFTPYLEYRDSGIEWIGKIPKEWEGKKISSVFEFPKDKVSDVDYEPLSVTYGGIKKQVETAAKSDDGTNRKKVLKGDIAINGRSDRKGAVGVSEYDGSISLVYHVLRKRDRYTETRFFHYLLRSKLFSEEFYRWGRGIVDDLWTTRSDEMKRIGIPVPPIKTQKKIAEYLDEKTVLIDQIIEKKKKLIELLREKRTAVINHAVTKGLDSTVSLKNSPIEWVDRTPYDWNTVSLRWVTHRFAGGTPSKDNHIYWDGGTIPWLNSGSVNQGIIDVPSAYITEEGFRNSSARWVPVGSLVMALAGQGKTKGTVAYLAIEATCNQSMAAIIPKKINARYLYWWLTSQYKNIRGMAGDSLRDGLNLEMVGSVPCLLPSDKEQQEIVEYLDRKISSVDHTFEKIEDSVRLLQEFKSSLLSNVVTGKIKV